MQNITAFWVRQKETTAKIINKGIVVCPVNAGLRPDEFLNLNIIILPISYGDVLVWVRDVNGYVKTCLRSKTIRRTVLN